MENNTEYLKIVNRNLANELTKDFIKQLDALDDNLFIELSESLPKETINQIENKINSSEFLDVQEGIMIFKSNYKSFLIDKLKYYFKCLVNLDK